MVALLGLEDRFFSVIKTVCANMMRLFGRVHALLQCKNKGAVLPDWLKFIALLLNLPCFKASHFFFKPSYTLNQLHLRRLRGENFVLKFYYR